MNNCPFHTQACGLSYPCSKCRAGASHSAHIIVRFDSQVRRRVGYPSAAHTGYQPKRGGYWQRQAA